jgi:RND family efflux transporter MFP subunit
MSNHFSDRSVRLARSLAAIAVPLLFAAACAHDEPKPVERATVSAPTEVVQSATIPSTRTVAGIVRAANASPLSARMMGNIIRVHVAEGDMVRRGQVLIEIDPREARTQSGAAASAVAAAQANARLAETTFQRFSALRERNSVSAQEFDDMKAKRDAAQAELSRVRSMAAQADTYVEYSLVRAPMDGVVTARYVDPGAQAAPGMPLLLVEDAQASRVEATVPEELALHAGDAVVIEDGTRRIEARVTRVQPRVDATTRSSLVKIDLPQPMRPGSYVRVHFRTGERQAIVVPAEAIVRKGQLTSVFVVDSDGVARMRLITVGTNNEILSGLETGERIVRNPAGVTDGVKVS